MCDLTSADGNVILSPLGPDDVRAHLAGEDDLLVRWLNGGPGTQAGTARYIRHCTEQWATGGPLRAFGIRVGAERALAGTIDLRFEMPGLSTGQVNVAYGLYPAWRGQGLATRAVLLVCRYAAAEGADQAVIQVDPDNTGSAAVAHRAGFTYVGQASGTDGDRFDQYVRDLPAPHRAGDLRPKPLAPAGAGPIRVPAGLVVLVGPPASGKTSFVRALIARGHVDEGAVVSSDEIRAELFGTSPAEMNTDAADARIFAERDRRIVARLACGRTAIAESTNVTPGARARLVLLARRFNAPVTMLRFAPDLGTLLDQHAGRCRTDITTADVHAFAADMARHGEAGRLRSEGAHAVHDVPGRQQGATPAEAAARFSFM
ncbi:GNAT family N-acetyltransferase [Streptomyces sp. NPDC102402]|uniref:GNAT family N-acetyltransferase n=1 Tax=Streptomyces sp. NPDC102402 TaxID=3366169 RepID=UPI003827A27E